MAAGLLPDALWDLIEPLLPLAPPRPRGGRPRVSDRACLTGILFVLRSGVPWQMLPQELGCGSGMTCWRRLRDWQHAGIWDLMHFALLDWLARHGDIDWSRAVVDSCSVRAVCGGTQIGPNPTARPKRGTNRHLTGEGQGPPLPTLVTGATRNVSQEALALGAAIPPLQGERGRPRCRPDCVVADRGYDAKSIRHGLRLRRILPLGRDARYRAWQWPRVLALGRRTDICLAESVSPLAGPIRQAGRYSHRLPVARVCADLLARSADDLGDWVAAAHRCHRAFPQYGSHLQ